ncbi:immunoglobulin-like domain-containing protein [Polaribacter sp.]|uniref:immunoglobulin-like domain-containing protein n=1 Tax=Polaribacter sp. TaxID=1920175 RepID=UPI0025F65DB1|nr:immunoglobulin-like domain-containing protein [Polaribacter sp.]
MKKNIFKSILFCSFSLFSFFINAQTAPDEDGTPYTTCNVDGANETRTSNELSPRVNVGTIDDRTCYANYKETTLKSTTWGIYNITDGSNNQDAANTLQPRMERSLRIAYNTDVGSYVKFSGTFRILEVGDASGTNNDGTYIAQSKGQHTGGGGSPDPAICLYLAKPVFDANGNQIAFNIYAERILERGGSGAGREIVFLKSVTKNEEVNFILEVGFREDPNDPTKKIHYSDAVIGGTAFPFNIPDPERGTQSKIRYGAYRVKGGRAQIRWANTTHIKVENVATIVDGNEAPAITLLGDASINIDLGDTYTDSGSIAIDNYDGDITDDIVIDNPVDVNTAGTYIIKYNVTDSNNNTALEMTRTVIVGDVSQTITSLPGTIEVETGDLSQNNAHFANNKLGSGNGGTNNIVEKWRKTRINSGTAGEADSGAGKSGTIIIPVSVAADGNYNFTFTYFKNSANKSDDIKINSTDATGGNSSLLASFSMIRNDGGPEGTNTATTSSYSTQTVTGVPLTTGITYITFENSDSASLNLDNVIVAASSAPIPPTMTSTKDGEWNDPTVWTVSGTAATTPSATPTSEYDVVLGHVVTIPSNMGVATAKSIGSTSGAQLILRQNNTLTVEGDISLARSNDGMILYAQNGNFSTVTIGGAYTSDKKTTIVKRLSQDKWTLVSSGLSNAKQFKTLDDSRNYTVKEGNKYAFGSYDDSRSVFDPGAAAGTTGKYVYVTDDHGTGPVWGSGIGWATKSNNAGGSKHDVVFMGDLHTDDVSVAVSTDGNGYNLVGNPYPTYLYGNPNADAINVLTANSSLIDGTIWFWDSDNETWVTKNLSSNAFHIQPLQGFFVKTTTAGDFSFTEAMQTHESNSNPFYKTTNSRFEIDLSIASGKLNRKTSIRYIDGKTTSFDNGYDSNIFGGYASELELYTGLVDGNSSKKLAIQSLPNENYEDMIIPVGVTADADSEITFSAETLNVPTGYKVFLEDRLKSTFTRLDEVNSAYTAIVSEKSTEGRFYLHAKSSALSTDTELLNSVSIYKSNTSTLRIVGLSQGKASVKLFNILGKQVMSTNFNTSGVKEITLPNLASGVYIVQLETEAGKLNKKIVLE